MQGDRGKDPPHLVLAHPGRLETRTGGFIYDARIARGLIGRGWRVDPLPLGHGFPLAPDATLDEATRRLRTLPAGCRVLIDGLAWGALGARAATVARHVRPIALVHHPLALETGLTPDQAARLHRSERRALAAAPRIVTTSHATSALLIEDYAVPAERITVAPPGTDEKPAAPGSRDGVLRLLAVGAVIPRKDFATLIEALARTEARRWHLTIAGALDRDPGTTAALRDTIARHRLAGRITLAGECDAAALDRLYRGADLFLSTALFEGFGMAAADAVAHGLPVLAADAGAIGEAVPESAARFFPPGDAAALAALLDSLSRDTLADLRAGARAARRTQRRWSDTVAVLAEALARA
ncbi:MAG: glycosyltransferase family 4 protein [Geminicoccaceae bacterium]|nr:glycosyltransferase family 4 protein [Geminicoccaceae bacterium]